MINVQMTPEIEALKSKLNATWTPGDFAGIAKPIEAGAEEFVVRLSLKQGVKVLDVACGSGNIAIPAARTALRKDPEQLWTENNRATDGMTEVESEYFEVTPRRL